MPSNPFEKILQDIENGNFQVDEIDEPDIDEIEDDDDSADEIESTSVTSTDFKIIDSPESTGTTHAPQQILKTPDQNIVDWGIKLENVSNDGLTINEFDKIKYLFKPVLDPNNCQTGYFTIHSNKIGEREPIKDPLGNSIKKDGQIVTRDKWNTANTTVTKVYYAGRLQKFTNWLESKVKLNSCGIQSVSPFHVSWNGKLNQKIEVFPDEINKLVFQAISGIDGDQFNDISNTMEVNILNSYNGKTSVYLDFIINIAAKDINGNDYQVKDFFTLSRKSHKVQHRGLFNEIVSDIAIAASFIDTEMAMLKAYNPSNKEIDSIGSKLKEGTKKAFKDNWQSLAAPHQNLFYCLLLASVALNNTYTAQRHAALRAVVDKIVVDASADYEKKLKKAATASKK